MQGTQRLCRRRRLRRETRREQVQRHGRMRDPAQRQGMETGPQMVWPDPIIGYRRFVDGVCRAIFEDHAGQYICDEGRERIYGLYLIFEMDNPWTVVL